MYQQKNSLYFYIGKVTVTVLNKYIFTKKWKTQQILALEIPSKKVYFLK